MYSIITEYPYEALGNEHKIRYNVNDAQVQLAYCNHIFHAIHESTLALKQLSENHQAITVQSLMTLLDKTATFRRQLAVKASSNLPEMMTSLRFGEPRLEGNIQTSFNALFYQDYHLATIQLICKHTGKPNRPDSIIEILKKSPTGLVFQVLPLSDPDENLDEVSMAIKKASTAVGGPYITASIQDVILDIPVLTFHHLPIGNLDLYLTLAFYHFKRFLVEKASSDEKLEQLMRCIYYIDVATPYHRGSAEIVNIVHMAMRAHMGLPTRNVHFVHLLDRVALTSLNYAEFRNKYLLECHPKLNEQGAVINWDDFEAQYQENNPKVHTQEMGFASCDTWASLAIKYLSNKERSSDSQPPLHIRMTSILNGAKDILCVQMGHIASLTSENFVEHVLNHLWTKNKLEAMFFSIIVIQLFASEANRAEVVRLQNFRKDSVKAAPYLAVLEAACLNYTLKLQDFRAKDVDGKLFKAALAYLDATTPRDPAIESSPARALLKPSNTSKPTISTATLQQRQGEKDTSATLVPLQKTDEKNRTDVATHKI